MNQTLTAAYLARLTEEQLRRKIHQADDMNGLALRDNDVKDAQRHRSEATQLRAELRQRSES